VSAVKGNAKSGVRSRARPRTGDDAGLLAWPVLVAVGRERDGWMQRSPTRRYIQGRKS
jgi:hypothetical protein